MIDTSETTGTSVRLPPTTTLASLLQDHIVPIETLSARHGAAATMAKVLLGIVPNSGKYLEIWPPANRMYYVMVPCFLNLPAFVFGWGAPANLISLAVYTSSLAAGCPYCSSHTCTFAVRRGVDAQKLNVDTISSHHGGDSTHDNIGMGTASSLYTEAEESVIDVAQKLARFPCQLTNEQRQTLQDQINDPTTVESIVLAMGMIGYLNKSMDALGIPLEVETYRETRNILGPSWSPGANGQLVDPQIHTAEPFPLVSAFHTYWAMLLQGPSAMSFEWRTLAGIPNNAAAANAFLLERYGYECPVLYSLRQKRAICAITAMIHECFNHESSVIGIQAKLAVGQVFASITGSQPAQEVITAMAIKCGSEVVHPTILDVAQAMAQESDPFTASKKLMSIDSTTTTMTTHGGDDATAMSMTGTPTKSDTPPPQQDQLQALLVLAHAISWSPARVNASVVSLLQNVNLVPSAIVEVVAIASVLQMLHRVSMFYRHD